MGMSHITDVGVLLYAESEGSECFLLCNLFSCQKMNFMGNIPVRMGGVEGGREGDRGREEGREEGGGRTGTY